MTSSVRAVTVSSRLADLQSSLRRHREAIVGLLAEVDEVLEEVALLAAPVAALEDDTDDGTDMAHLLANGELGAIVLRAAEEHGVPLRQILGPGACHLAKAQRARLAAIRAVLAVRRNKSDAARVLRITPEAVRMTLGRAERKAAA